jgi:ubiquitin-conjugating enzyme E2 variant
MANALALPVQHARTPGPTEYVGVGLFAVLCLLVVGRFAAAVEGSAAPAVLASALFGYVCADFLSGLVHGMFDTWWSAETPVVGKTFVVPFRLHHAIPKEITWHGFVATNGHNCLVTAPVLAICLLVDPGTMLGASAITFLFTLCFGTFLTNQFHRWAHEDRVGPFVAFLQRTRLILSKEAHDKHHVRPYDKAYCITTGWLNGPLHQLGFYRAVERVITRVTGVQPRKDDLEHA